MSKSDSYRAEVERRDRQSLWISRSATAVGAALAVWLAVWSSGLDRALPEWLKSRAIAARVTAVENAKKKAPPPPPLVLDKPAPPTFGGQRSSISKSPRRLILTGTLPGRSPYEGLAFIGIDARHPQTYSAGALLANGARLVAIFPRYVVLQKYDRQARLYLGGGHDQDRRSSLDSVLSVGGRQTLVPAVANSEEEFTDFIRQTPLYDGVTVRGFQVYPGKQAAVFAQMGLRPGDVITAVDGMPLTDPTMAVEAFRQLAAGTSETAELIRDGKPATVTLDGSLIAGELEREREAATGSAPNGVPST